MRAISGVRTSRTVIEATTSSRLSFSLTLLRRISPMCTARPPPSVPLAIPCSQSLVRGPLALSTRWRYAADVRQGIPGGEQARKLSMDYTTDFKSIRGQVSAEEWQARVDLAACYPLVGKYGMTHLLYNHITARIPGGADHLLINLYGMLYKEITASSLVKIDVEG